MLSLILKSFFLEVDPILIIQIFLLDVKKSFEDAHLEAKVNLISPDTMLNAVESAAQWLHHSI